MLTKRPTILRTDVLMLTVIYGGLLPVILYLDFVPQIYTKFVFVLTFFFNCLFLFVCETNHRYKSRHCFWRTTDIAKSTHVDVIEKLKSGSFKHKVVPLESAEFEYKKVVIFFHDKLKYYFDSSEKKFRKVKPFLHQPCSRLVSPNYKPFANELEEHLVERNQLRFPLPNFFQIFREHLMDPLNFFQF